MKRPTFTVIIPSIGYETLANTIKSIQRQELVPGDQFMVVADGHIESTEALVKAAGAPFEYHAYGPTRTWGNDQRNFGLMFARGDYLVWMDEDDIFYPDAFAAIREAAMAHPGRPLIFRMQGPEGDYLWKEQVIQCCRIGGHMFVTPNIKGKVGRWGTHYEGDFQFIRSTMDLWGDDSLAVWDERFIANLRPHVKGSVWCE